MQIFRSFRSFVIAVLIVAATFVAARAAQDTDASRRPADRRLQEHLCGVGVGCRRTRDRQERHDALRHEADDRNESRRPRRDVAGEARAGGAGHAGAVGQALGRDHRRSEARRRGRHRHGRHPGHRRDGQPHGHGRRRTRHGRHGARRRHSRSLGCAPHGPDRLRAVQVACVLPSAITPPSPRTSRSSARASPSVRATSSSPTRTASWWCRRTRPRGSSRKRRPSTIASVACIRSFASSNRCRRRSRSSIASDLRCDPSSRNAAIADEPT